MTYVVKDWATLFENASSRKLKVLGWVPIPNSHDSVAYATLMQHKGGPEIFAAWILMVQLASRCAIRGTLASSDGRPYGPAEMAVKTRAPERIFKAALPHLCKAGWLMAKPAPGESADTLGESADTLADVGRLAAANRIEGNGIEKKTNTASRWCVIYESYPRKVGRKDAEKPIRAAIDAKGFEELHEAVKAFAKATAKVEKRFIPHPGTWFRQGRYDDDPAEWGVNADGRLQMPQGNNSTETIIKDLQRQTANL